MAEKTMRERLLDALEGGAAGQGLDIVDVELAGPKTRPIVRVRLDVLEGGPIDMDRVTEATPWVSEVVEGLDLIAGAYDLEVSSPGVDRPLRRPADFARFAGERAEVKASAEVDGRKTWTGTIVSAEDGVVCVDADGATHAIPFDQVLSAKLKPDYEQLLAAAKRAARDAAAKGEEALDDLDGDADLLDDDEDDAADDAE